MRDPERPLVPEQVEDFTFHLLEGDLAAGDKLSVVDLTRTLDCSRVPVMEALKRLAGDGFVQIVPQVGCRVVTPRADDVRDF